MRGRKPAFLRKNSCEISGVILNNPNTPLSEVPLPPDEVTLNFARRHGDRISAQGIGLAGLTGLAVAWLFAHQFSITESSQLLVLFLSCTALPMAVLNFVVNHAWLRASSGLRLKPKPVNWSRCIIKFTGLAGTLLMLALCYWLFPEYAKAYYQPVWITVNWVLLPVLLLAVPYIIWVDCRMIEPEDGYWHTGLALLGRWREVNLAQIKAHTLGWLVKGFFLPFMLAGAVAHLDFLTMEGGNFSTFNYLFATTLNLILLVDVTFGSIGYLLTLRVLDSHITSTETTWLGWLSAVICYKPFAAFFWITFLNYQGKTNWINWLQPYPILFITWGFVILILHAVYLWATCSFGCRFSNLTNRGIIVDGPYRYLKHPAYVSKNIAWWMMAVPFVAQATGSEALRACICLLLTNGIYVIRALTEERHLLHDPAYVRYSCWIEQHGAFSSLWRVVHNILRRKP